MVEEERYRSLAGYYPHYLKEHAKPATRVLHFVGTGLISVWLLLMLLTGDLFWLLLIPLVGFGSAWIGHYFFEKNKPATFRYPIWSLASDFILFWQLLTGREKFDPDK